MFAGVAGFPPVDADDTSEDHPARLRAPPAPDRSGSPYDNFKPPKHPTSSLDQQRKARDKVFRSIDSLAAVNGDVSASSDDESGIARTQSITSFEESADSWPRSRRGHAEVGGRGQQAVTSSLPDLVTSSEIGRRAGMSGSFIGGMRDIDSLLGFGETEDELEMKSADDDDDDDSESNDASQSDASFATSLERQQNHRDDSGRRTRSPRPQSDTCLVGNVEDIDDVLGTQLVPSHLGTSAVTERTPAQTASLPETTDSPSTPIAPSVPRDDVGGPLHVVIAPQTSVDLSSSDSLLDTPVPDTPDVPLSPMPAFFTPTGKTQSMDQLNVRDAAAADQGSRGRAKSSGNLDDLDRLLGTMNGGTGKSSSDDDSDDDDDDSDESSEDDDEKKESSDSDSESESQSDSDSSSSSDDDSAVMKVSKTDDGSDSQPPTIALPVPTDTLVDLNFPASAAASREATPATEKARRSELAVASALTKHAENGQVTIGQLTEICRHQRRRKPPWIEDEEDRRFTGYHSVTEALEAMDVDVKKVCQCVSLYYAAK